MTNRTYGTRLPGLTDESLTGKLIVVEGADGSAGRRRSRSCASGSRSKATR